MNSIINILIFSLILACVPVIAAEAAQQSKKGAKVQAWEQRQELDAQLIDAVLANNVTLVKQLIARGARVNAFVWVSNQFDYPKNKALQLLAKQLIEHAAEFNLGNSVPVCPIYIAIASNNTAMFKLLIEHGADKKVALKACIYYKHEAFLKILMQYNINLDDALMITAIIGHLELCKILLSHGANANAQDSDGTTALMFAAWRDEKVRLHDKTLDDLGICKLLLEHGANIDLQNKLGITALHTAVFFGEIEIAKFLIKAGANVNIKDIDGHTPLDYSTRSQNQEMRELLLAHGATGSIAPAAPKQGAKSRWKSMKKKVRRFLKQI